MSVDMKKIASFILSSVLCVGCAIDEPYNEMETRDIDAPVFYASFESDAETKTYLNESGYARWTADDRVSIFAGNTFNQQYVFDGETGANSGSFTKVPDDSFVTGSTFSANYAVYPYNATTSISEEGVMSVSLPAVQSYAENSYGLGANTMVAATSGTDDTMLLFKNACGYLILSLYGDATITSITITGNNNEKIAGTASITTTSGGAPSLAMGNDATSSITLDCGDGVTLGETAADATVFWFVVPPTEFTEGFSISAVASDGSTMEKSTSRDLTINRNTTYSMAALEFTGEAPGKELTFTSTGQSVISLVKKGTPDAITLEYRTSGDWIPYEIGTGVTLQNGESVSFRAGAGGNATFNKNTLNYYRFQSTGTGTIAASGNIMSLLDPTMKSKTIPCNYCFTFLFEDFTFLTSAPELPATTLTNYCYNNMFNECIYITSAPELPATTLAEYCYNSMFYGCTRLASAPELPATTLANYCYNEMFSGCTNLTSVPEVLPATTLTTMCYQHMFYGCKSMKTAPSLPATTLVAGCYYGMFQNCTGLTSAPELTATTLNYYCYQDMFYGCTSLTSAPELPVTALAFRCYYRMFYGCSKLESAPKLPVTTLAEACYYQMFYGCTSLASAPELPATTLVEDCYYQMFYNCKSLTAAPSLPATTLVSNCYQYLFYGCSSLETAPSLPATTLASYCYNGMFQNCTSLKSAPEKLPATTLAERCYQDMFYGCTSLKSAPELAATTLASNCCSSMFRNCTSLTSAPELPATTLASGCYSQMFYNCTNLTSSPKVLPATTLASNCYYNMFNSCSSLTSAPDLPATILDYQCYSGMFRYCSNLSYIKMLATNVSAYFCLDNWVSGISQTGTFVKSPDATWDIFASGIPSGWTITTLSD